MTRHHPSVSIVIPTRRRPDALRRCLKSLSTQTYRRNVKDVIVVDDGPSLETEACVRSLAVHPHPSPPPSRGRGKRGEMPLLLSLPPLRGKAMLHAVPSVARRHIMAPCRPRQGVRMGGAERIPIVYLAQSSQGANAARNRGIRAARGDIVVLMDDDAVAPETWLEKLAGGLERSGVEVAGGAIRLRAEGPLIGKHREEVRSLFAEVLEPARTDDGRVVPVTCNMAAFRKVFDRALFDETVRPPIEEVDWLVRAQATSVFLPDAWLWHEKSPQEVSLGAALRLAWNRGSETGWWSRVRLGRPHSRRMREAGMSAWTMLFSVGHVARRRCLGGLLTATGEAGRFMAVLGLINRGARVPKSWR